MKNKLKKNNVYYLSNSNLVNNNIFTLVLIIRFFKIKNIKKDSSKNFV